ncbi:hypothetical protein [Paenisporosarcina sp. NPDC076898]
MNKLEKLKKQAEDLYDVIKRSQKEIDNPALVTGILSELTMFIDNVEDEE